MCTQMNAFYRSIFPDYLTVGCGAIVRIGQFEKVVSLANEQLVGDGADVL